MSTAERSHRRRRRTESGPPSARTPTFRTAASLAAGLFVIGGAYKVCFAQTGVGVLADYPTPSDTQIKAGYARCFYVNVLTTEDNKKWYSVTQRAETRIELQDPDICLVKMDGTKNIFMVPASTPKSCDGKIVTIVATFSPAG